MRKRYTLSQDAYLAMGRFMADMWSGYNGAFTGYSQNVTSFIEQDAQWHVTVDRRTRS